MTNEDVARLNQLHRRVTSASGHIRLEQFLTPQNGAEESSRVSEAFERGDSYDPVFRYATLEQNPVGALLQIRQSIEPDRSAWDALVADDLDYEVDLLEATRRHDPAAITATTLARHGDPSDLVADAENILQRSTDAADETRDIDASTVASVCRTSLDGVGLDEWSVIIEPRMNARMSVRAVAKEVRVAADALFGRRETRRLLVHELGTHVLRAVNGSHQPLAWLQTGAGPYVATEEGLARVHERMFAEPDAAALRRYAARALAADLSRAQGFFSVYARLRRHLDHGEAFSVVARVKRGIERTAEHGAYVKDQAYLRGVLEVEALLEAKPQAYRLLLSGKVGVRQLQLLEDLESQRLLVKPSLRPSDFIRSTPVAAG